MERLEQDLSKAQFKYTQLLLGWLVRSKRPLKWSEIQVASSINLHIGEESNELDPNQKICDDVEDLCGSLVQKLDGDRIELVHSTARLYVLAPASRVLVQPR